MAREGLSRGRTSAHLIMRSPPRSLLPGASFRIGTKAKNLRFAPPRCKICT